jgi:hypothetical protein
MRAKAKAVAAAADEERRRAAAAAAPGGKAPAGLQMHEQAAAAMEVALDAALDAQDPPSHPSSQRAGQLAALLAATACALRVAARAAASCRPLSQSVPACWLPGGRVAAKAQAALSRYGPLLAAACPSREGLLPHEHSALRQAMAAVAAYLAAVGPVDGIAAALVGALAELQLTFVDAGALVPGGAAAGAPAGGGAGAPATALFDDDLDVGGAVMVAARCAPSLCFSCPSRCTCSWDIAGSAAVPPRVLRAGRASPRRRCPRRPRWPPCAGSGAWRCCARWRPRSPSPRTAPRWSCSRRSTARAATRRRPPCTSPWWPPWCAAAWPPWRRGATRRATWRRRRWASWAPSRASSPGTPRRCTPCACSPCGRPWR